MICISHSNPLRCQSVTCSSPTSLANRAEDHYVGGKICGRCESGTIALKRGHGPETKEFVSANEEPVVRTPGGRAGLDRASGDVSRIHHATGIGQPGDGG